MKKKKPPPYKRAEELGFGVTLYLADCVKLLPYVIAEVHHTITDAPYEDHMHNAKAARTGLRTDGHASPKPVSFASITAIRAAVTPHLTRVTGGWLIIFCTPEGITPWRDAIEAAGARYKRACFWAKTDAAPQFNGQGPSFAVEPMVTAWCGPGHSSWNGGGGRNWWDGPTSPSDRHGLHETEKPLWLMSTLVTKFTDHGQTVLDPFMGTGATGVACARAGRGFIGIEKDEKYFEAACQRIKDELTRPDMLIAQHPAGPKQETMMAEWPKQKRGKA